MDIEFSVNSDKSAYTNSDGTLTRAGSKAAALTMVGGLIGNIHACHKSGSWDSAEHLRWIISRLEDGFAQANVKVK